MNRQDNYERIVENGEGENKRRRAGKKEGEWRCRGKDRIGEENKIKKIKRLKEMSIENEIREKTRRKAEGRTI